MNLLGLTRTALIAAAVFAAAFALSACGRKGDIIPPGTIIPDQVRDLRAEPRAGAVVLAWTVPSKNTDGSPIVDLDGFDVMRARLPEGSDECECEYEAVGTVYVGMPGDAVVTGRRVAWSDRSEALESGARYGYKVYAFNTGGYRGPESNHAAVLFLPPPATPEGLTAVPGDRAVTLSWQAAAPGEAPIVGYNVYRSKTAGARLVRPVNREPVPSTSFNDTGLENGAAYYYLVTALAGHTPPFSEGGPTGEVVATPADLVAPEPPSGLQAVPAEGSVLVSWLPPADEDVTGYILYRQGPGDEAPSPLPGMPTNRISYTDSRVEAGRMYLYAVSAVDDASPPNESVLSEKAAATVPVEAVK